MQICGLDFTLLLVSLESKLVNYLTHCQFLKTTRISIFRIKLIFQKYLRTLIVDHFWPKRYKKTCYSMGYKYLWDIFFKCFICREKNSFRVPTYEIHNLDPWITTSTLVHLQKILQKQYEFERLHIEKEKKVSWKLLCALLSFVDWAVIPILKKHYKFQNLVKLLYNLELKEGASEGNTYCWPWCIYGWLCRTWKWSNWSFWKPQFHQICLHNVERWRAFQIS